ncbi:MAG TPA: hypothetical protein VFH51_11105 [Myxococcota bacterium]|nr:hypothetical protein [Myxococcota bacterium]
MPAFDGLRERVHPSAVLRAEAYVRQRRVLEVSYRDPKTLVGLVQGSLRAPYRCLLRRDLEEPDHPARSSGPLAAGRGGGPGAASG